MNTNSVIVKNSAAVISEPLTKTKPGDGIVVRAMPIELRVFSIRVYTFGQQFPAGATIRMGTYLRCAERIATDWCLNVQGTGWWRHVSKKLCFYYNPVKIALLVGMVFRAFSLFICFGFAGAGNPHRRRPKGEIAV